MSLITEVKKICDRLAPHGWRDLLMQHGLDITASDLQEELLREIPRINRDIRGFQDFALEGKQGVVPRNPARSLLFHAFASPDVIKGAKAKELTAFPTLAEIETIENFVFGIRPPSIEDLKKYAKELSDKTRRLTGKEQDGNYAIVVFAYEYRPAYETVHQKHADMCFSRTGVSRVGTTEPLYDETLRGFLPFNYDDEFDFRVLPSRYAAFFAVQLSGYQKIFGPMRTIDSDRDRKFWVPLHKIFSGKECIKGLNLNVSFEAYHVNEKIRRIHMHLKGDEFTDEDLTHYPFKFTSDIAYLSTRSDFSQGVLVPTPHPRLVEPAEYNGSPLFFKVPKEEENKVEFYESSLNIVADIDDEGQIGSGPRHAPEYVHVRTGKDENGPINMNDKLNVIEEIKKDNYYAQHYVDYTADGWISVVCPELAILGEFIPAYSLVTAPDFYSKCDQGDVYSWWLAEVPKMLRSGFWYRGGPNTLSDERLAPNLTLTGDGAHFTKEDDTVTSIVCLPSEDNIITTTLKSSGTLRHAYLPDAASGVFAPGWDISFDRTNGTEHLASYGLGSPFPEDSKLCAALSAFWPSVAPDAGRSFWWESFHGVYPTVCPLTDEEIGQANLPPWDGSKGPKRINKDGRLLVEYLKIEYVDYVYNSLKKAFTLSQLGKNIDTDEFEARMLAMNRAYQSAGLLKPHPPGEISQDDRDIQRKWPVLSFKKVRSDETELQEAQTKTRIKLKGNIYRIEIFHAGDTQEHEDHRKIQVEIRDKFIIFVGNLRHVLIKKNDGTWKHKKNVE